MSEKTKSEIKDSKIEYAGPKFGVRHLQLTLLLTLNTIAYTQRVNLSVGIVAMTDNSTTSNPDIPTYDWTDSGTVLSSFFWGYIVLQTIAGHIVKLYGPRIFLMLAMTISSIACILIPTMAAAFGSKGVIVCRVLQGLSQGFIFPSIHTLLGQWVPVPERSTSGTFVYSGTSVGTIIGMPLTGAIAASWWGWPAAFYFFGGLGLVWMAVWAVFGSNKPSESKTITKEEQKYIESSLGHEYHVEVPTPWKDIFTSMPFWAIIVANCGQNWGYVALLTNIPTYLNKVMNFDMENNSLISASPYIAAAVFSYIFGPVSDFLINRNIFSRVFVRKLMNSIGTILPAISLTALGFVPDDQPYLSVCLLILTVGINSAVTCGYQINHIDLSPNHSGTLMGLANGSSQSFSIISPLVLQAIVTKQTDKHLWRIVFIISSCMYIASNAFYVVFGTASLQSWNEEKPNNKKLNKEEV